METKFYETIREYYDYIFPLNNKQVEFVKGYFIDEKSKLLEVGCANGKLTNALNNYEITGIDLEEEFVKIASQRYEKPKFKAMNMLNVDELDGKFDGIVCFGNTMVHLSIDDIRIFIEKSYEKLNAEGNILIQILNYDYILDDKIEELPLISNETIEFKRNYLYGENLKFKTKLTIKKTSEIIDNSITLYPIRKEILINLMEDAGFKDIDVFGSFNKDDLKSKSIPLIISGKK